jgi:phage terminase large subunit-like protein
VLGTPLMPWQQQVVDVALELDGDGLPAYREIRVTVPRQSGKTSMILAVEVDRCIAWGGLQHVLYAAQDRINSRAKWEEQCQLLRQTPLRAAFKQRRATGLEATIWPGTGSVIGITASGETSGHGQTLDLGIIDEAFAQKDERLAQAFRPAMLTRQAAQMWVLSTMGTEESIFLHDRVDDGRLRVEAGERSGVAYFEWSAGPDDDPDDPETWWRCMPALGRTVTEKVVQDDHDAMTADGFARAYLNQRTGAGQPVIPELQWRAAVDGASQLRGTPVFAIDITPSREHASVAVAGWRHDGRVHLELVDNRQGTDWIVARVEELYRKWHPWPVVVDPASPAGSLLVDFAALGVPTETISARDYAHGCGAFYDAVVASPSTAVHRDQPSLNLAVAAARKRVLGDAWAWARKVGGDISPLVAVTLARWGLVRHGDGKAQIL